MNPAMRRLGPRAAPDRPRAPWRWALAGALLGGLLGLALLAPASWLARWVADRSGQRFVLADARGTLWSGSALAVLGGGPGSRDASALPGRLQWHLGWAAGPQGGGLELALRQACCIDDVLRLRLQPGIGRLRVSTAAPVRAHWPAAWLAGLGAPFNTLRLGGGLQLQAEDLSVEDVQGRLRVSGQAELRLQDLSSRLGPLPTLGSYRLVLSGAADGDEGARVALQTLQGPLRLSGQGQWSGARLRFRGQAEAEPGSEAMLNNLLNLLGQRQGALALLAIG